MLVKLYAFPARHSGTHNTNLMTHNLVAVAVTFMNPLYSFDNALEIKRGTPRVLNWYLLKCWKYNTCIHWTCWKKVTVTNGARIMLFGGVLPGYNYSWIIYLQKYGMLSKSFKEEKCSRPGFQGDISSSRPNKQIQYSVLSLSRHEWSDFIAYYSLKGYVCII